MKFVEHRIADNRVLRLIRKFLQAGIFEDGTWSKTVVGTPQGAVISPLLAILLHYALDLWVNRWRNHHARGEVYIVRYADDFVMGFQYQADAKQFHAELIKRMETFGLELHSDKTRLIEFGRFAAENRKERGKEKPSTFSDSLISVQPADLMGNSNFNAKPSVKGCDAKLKKYAKLSTDIVIIQCRNRENGCVA